jgi:hypothetical protein
MISHIKKGAYTAYQAAWRPLFAPVHFGENIFDREWDALILLDACRVDALSALAPEYDFIGEVGSIRSLGSQSKEWLAKNFTRSRLPEIERTAYVSANPFLENVFCGGQENDRRLNPANWESAAADDFAALVDISQQGWDSTLGTVPPDRVTETAIRVGRETDWDRLVVHYMQPHTPYIGADDPDLRSGNVVELARREAVTAADLWDAYLETLRLALDEVATLLHNLDAPRVVISADHGESFGEWHIYGHPIGFLHPAVKRVPWAEMSATDTGTEAGRSVRENQVSREEQLRSLGYLD